MTAIAGAWRLDGRGDAGDLCESMLASLRPYGPHACDQWNKGAMAAGRALHRLLPEDQYDHQPLLGAGGTALLVADVRLDNREDLADALGLATARELCDAAILLAAFERWGDDLVDHIVGDFAFAVLEPDRRRVTLARDPLGQRPLHYHRSDGLFAFASMPKGLHALEAVPRAPDLERVAEFLALLPERGSRTCFAGVERVEAGQVVTVTPGGVSARRYWPPARRELRLGSPRAYEEGLRHHLDQAVKARLRGCDGGVATHLSAGLDSSIVTATAARCLSASGGRVAAFTAVPHADFASGPDASRISDEGPLAAMLAARHENIDHVLIRNQAPPPFDGLDRYFYLFEQPVRDLPTGEWFGAILAESNRRGLKVLLPAYLGNLTLSYNGLERLPRDIAQGRWLRWAREAGALVRKRRLGWKTVLALSFGPYAPPALWRSALRMSHGVDRGMAAYTGVNPAWLEELAVQADARRADLSGRPHKDGYAARLWALQRIDMGAMNKGALAGWGVDQRDPTTDRRLVEFCLATPEDQFLSGGEPRALARRSFVDRVPKDILDETRRGHLSADWSLSVSKAQAEVLGEIDRLAQVPAAGAVLDLAYLRRLAEDWPTDGWDKPAVEARYRSTLMRALAVGHFLRKASGDNH